MAIILGWITLVVALVIAAAVAYHLIGVFWALKKGADHLQKLAGGLAVIRDNTAPLNGRIDSINSGLSILAPPLLAANGNLAAIVQVAADR